MKSITIREALLFLQKELSELLGSFAQPQSEEILEFLFNCSRSELYLSSNRILSNLQIEKMKEIANRRLSGEPLPYILGKTYFFSREFTVTPDILIPRPDTEILVEQILLNEKQKYARFADVGIGSGIISCILTETNPHWLAVGIDISFKALKIAKLNRVTPVQLLCSDLLSAVKFTSAFDFIVSNPPYISADEVNTLDPEVKDFEPHLALYGGIDGLEFYRKLSIDAKKVLREQGRLYCEIGYNQQFEIENIFVSSGWTNINFTKDLAGHPRVMRVVYPGAEK